MQKDLRKKIRNFLMTHAYVPYIGPASLWIILFVIAPVGVILYFSFLTTGPLGEIIPAFTFKNYLVFKGVYGRIIFRSLLFAFGTNMICLLIGYPLAYFIVGYGNRWKTFLMLLVIIPSWTCYLIRIYGLTTLIGTTGLINSILLSSGLISSPLKMLYSPSAVMLGLVYSYLPFMVLPIYASLDGLDSSLLEASADLGATPLHRFFTVTLPLTKGGIFAGTILVFIPSLGEWVVPFLLGGNKVMMAGNLVERYFIKIGNVPVGCSIATVLTAIVILIIYLSLKWGGEEVLEKIT